MRTTWTFHSAIQLRFGRDAVLQAGEIAGQLKVKRAFIVTDQILRTVGILDQVLRPLHKAGIATEVFDGGEPEPSLGMVERCIEAGRLSNPDCVIGLGGGSNMDTAKLTAIILTHGGKLHEYVGDMKVPGPVMPLICIPTTAGTGSEVSAAAVFTDTERQIKVSCLSNYLRPTVALVDPMLTLSCPPKVTADSGIDALTHAIEAYTAIDNSIFPLTPGENTVYQGKHPLGDVMAEKAIALVGQFLRRAVSKPDDYEAREGMALAATLGGLAFSNVGVALVHAMEYPVGGVTHCSHGAGNGLLLPFVMKYNLGAKPKEFASIARLLGEDITGLSEADAAMKAVTAVESLRRDIGIPTRLRDLGVKEEHFKPFAEKTFNIKRLMRVNPRYPTQDEIESLFREAW